MLMFQAGHLGPYLQLSSLKVEVIDNVNLYMLYID